MALGFIQIATILQGVSLGWSLHFTEVAIVLQRVPLRISLELIKSTSSLRGEPLIFHEFVFRFYVCIL
jgi:hypothetical protein